MLPDRRFVVETFNTFNLSIFNSELPLPSISLTRARTFRGKLTYRKKRNMSGRMECYDFEIRISTLFNLERKEWEDVVIHEMIHYYIAFKGIPDTSSHGAAFRKMMHAINRQHKRGITISSRSTENENADSRLRAHYVCLAKFSDGRLGVAPVAKTRIFELWNVFLSFPDVVSMKWVGVIDPWFNRFPRVMTPKLYLAKKEELEPHLKGGVLLERDGNVVRPVSRRCYPDELLP